MAEIKLDAAAAATPPDSPKWCNSSPAGWPATAYLAASLKESGGDPGYGIQNLCQRGNGSFPALRQPQRTLLGP